jgi:hypothetical protein
MAKDPAVLFYTSDFLTGCALMSMAQRGKYITLLCLQHQQGHLSEEDMLDVCGAVDPKIWRKFKQDDDGLFYNERMETECERRKNFVLSKVENGKKGGRPKKEKETDSKPIGKREQTDSFAIAKATEKLLENENINTLINRDIKSIDKSNSNKDKETDIYTFKAPTVEEVAEYCSERGNNVDAERFVSYYTANGWKVSKNPMQDWKAAVRSWESNGIANEKKTAAPELAKSFENDEFYSRALAASRKRMEV